MRTVSNQIDTELAQIFAQHRTWRKAAAYTDALTACDTPVKTCWGLAEKAGHGTPGPFQSLIAENQWDHHEIWNRIATSVPRLVSCPVGDPLGPGVAVDETAQPKRGHHTVGTGTQWAGCLGHTTNCVTSVFCSYITPQAGTWIAHGLFLPEKSWFTGAGATGKARRASAGVPDDAVFQTKPQIARREFQKLRDRDVGFTWATGDEVYGRYGALRDDHEKTVRPTPASCRRTSSSPPAPDAGTVPSGWPSAPRNTSRSARRDQGVTGPRWYEWVMIEAGPLLVRRCWSDRCRQDKQLLDDDLVHPLGMGVDLRRQPGRVREAGQMPVRVGHLGQVPARSTTR
ncbi:MAG: transposase [Pseudonocardiales bacterium]